jgi:hypothetical protein
MKSVWGLFISAIINFLYTTDMRVFLTYALVIAVVFAALMGLYMPLVGMDMHCPFAPGCMTSLEHLQHWQSALAAIVTALLLVVAPVSFAYSILLPRIIGYQHRYQLHHEPLRPTLFQELLSRGVVHRKEPHFAAKLYPILKNNLWTKIQSLLACSR